MKSTKRRAKAAGSRTSRSVPPAARRRAGGPVPPEAPSARTRDRVLRAAGEVFGRKGYRAATVREICTLAGASIASVNYYFRDKESLYLEVMKDLLEGGLRRYPADLGLGPGAASAAERLEAFVRNVLRRLLGKDGWYGERGRGQLLVRELVDPSASMDRLVAEYLRPQRDILLGLMGELLGPGAPRESLERCALSIMGQCMHHAYGRPVLKRLGLAQPIDDASLERLARHVALFSLGGIERIRKSRKERGKTSIPTGGGDA